jgi:hypothetical protein
MSNLTGGCLYSAVRYELSGATQIELSCHCRDCQYVSGGAPAHVIVMRSEDVTIIKGQAKEYWNTSAKGRRLAPIIAESRSSQRTRSTRNIWRLKLVVLMIQAVSGRKPISGPNRRSLGTIRHCYFALQGGHGRPFRIRQNLRG